jgi:hypothetical protein
MERDVVVTYSNGLCRFLQTFLLIFFTLCRNGTVSGETTLLYPPCKDGFAPP